MDDDFGDSAAAVVAAERNAELPVAAAGYSSCWIDSGTMAPRGALGN